MIYSAEAIKLRKHIEKVREERTFVEELLQYPDDISSKDAVMSKRLELIKEEKNMQAALAVMPSPVLNPAFAGLASLLK